MSYEHQKSDPKSPWFPKGHSRKNLTGKWASTYPVIQDSCIRCLKCWIYCPDSAIRIEEKITPDLSFCKGCGICAQVCPVQAIQMEKKR